MTNKKPAAEMTRQELLSEFMELARELDTVQRQIVLYALKTGNVKDAEEGLKLYAAHKKQTA